LNSEKKPELSQPMRFGLQRDAVELGLLLGLPLPDSGGSVLPWRDRRRWRRGRRRQLSLQPECRSDWPAHPVVAARSTWGHLCERRGPVAARPSSTAQVKIHREKEVSVRGISSHQKRIRAAL